MSALDRMLAANKSYMSGFPGPRPRQPSLHLAVLSCMDSRLALFGALGLDIGEAHLIRNAGGVATPDTLRSLAISQHSLGTREIAVVQHTDCGMLNFDDLAFRNELFTSTGQLPPWDVPGFTDLRQSVRDSVDRIRASRFLPYRDSVRGFIFDVGTAELSQVD